MLSDNLQRAPGGALRFAGYDVAALAAKYATPLYLMDEERVRANCRMYKTAFLAAFGENALPLYASKAAAFGALYRVVGEEGLGVDVVSGGEIFTALRAGFPAERMYFHGNAKTDEEISYAVEKGVGYFVVDNIDELAAVQAAAAAAGRKQKVLLRITPGIDPHTYAAVNTGMVDSKFGAAVETGQALAFVSLALGQENLDVRGVHCHVGSMVFDEDVYERTVDIMVGFMAQVRDALGFTLRELDLGGGYGVRYTEHDKTVDIPARIAGVAARLREQCALRGFPVPRVLMEPGRSIVADAGLTVYTVQSVKRIPGYKSYVAVDGGMTDNPRYALYGSAYTVLPVGPESAGSETFDLVGRCCESGDILQPAVALPGDIRRGDLVAVCTTGAYNYSMASNYNRVGRPPVVMLAPAGDYTAVRRESWQDMCALDE